MEKLYSEDLLVAIKEKQWVESIYGMPVIIKPIPDTDIKGAMDTRLYQATKKQAQIMRWIPKRFLKMDTSPKSIERLRKMFNGIKSREVTSTQIAIEQIKILGLDNNDIPVKIYYPLQRKEKMPVLYYIHGGGFFAGSSSVIEQLVKMIVEKYNILAFSIDYRLAPENPYPKGHQDCYEVLKWIKNNVNKYHGDGSNIFVAGDSAGGNLAQYCTTRDKEDNLHTVKGQLLLYPTVNMAAISDEYSTWSIDKYEIYSAHKRAIMMSLGMFKDGSMNLLGDLLQTNDINTPYLSPYLIDGKDLPPTFLTVGEHDYLKVECLAFGAKLHRQGTEVKTILYKGMGHAYGDTVGVYPQSEDLANEMGIFIIEHLE